VGKSNHLNLDGFFMHISIALLWHLTGY